MSRLSIDDLQVSSFTTSSEERTIGIPTSFDPNCTTHPTPMTFCYWCPPNDTRFPEEQHQNF